MTKLPGYIHSVEITVPASKNLTSVKRALGACGFERIKNGDRGGRNGSVVIRGTFHHGAARYVMPYCERNGLRLKHTTLARD